MLSVFLKELTMEKFLLDWSRTSWLVILFFTQDRVQASHMKVLQQFHTLSVKSPGFKSIKKAGEDNCRNAFVQHTSSQSVQSFAWLTDPGVDLFVGGALFRNDIFDVLEFLHGLQLSFFVEYGWMAVSCSRAGLKQHFCLIAAGSKAARGGVCFNKPVYNDLEGRFSVR